MRNLLILFMFALIGCPCKQTGVEYPSTPCANGASSCINNRPYACGDGVWRPVGTVSSCAEVGGVCCVDRESGVHACVAQDHCASTDAGVSADVTTGG
jgi:hypothetical protein